MHGANTESAALKLNRRLAPTRLAYCTQSASRTQESFRFFQLYCYARPPLSFCWHYEKAVPHSRLYHAEMKYIICWDYHTERDDFHLISRHASKNGCIGYVPRKPRHCRLILLEGLIYHTLILWILVTNLIYHIIRWYIIYFFPEIYLHYHYLHFHLQKRAPRVTKNVKATVIRCQQLLHSYQSRVN